MTHLLLITQDDTIPINLREALAAPEMRVVIRKDPSEVQEAIRRGTFDAALIYDDNGSDHFINGLTGLRQLSQELFIVGITPHYSEGVEAEAFEIGANLYFAEPVPAQTLSRLILNCTTAGDNAAPIPQTATSPKASTETGPSSTTSALRVLRDFSDILRFSLDHRALTEHFILKLRDHIRFSRIAIFLESTAKQSLVKDTNTSQLECIASLGLPADLVECFQLNSEVGIGQTLTEQPRVLDAHQLNTGLTSQQESTIRKEFNILGCHLALPISDRERPLGVAVLNGPVTNREYSEDELELLYLLMEELGMAIRNSRLHAELASRGKLIENVLRSMRSGAIVVSENLEILYSNRSANEFLKLQPQPGRAIQWAELPAQVAGPVHRAVEKGEPTEPFTIEPSQGQSVYRVSIIPFSQKDELPLLPRPVMVMLEDFTHIEATQASALATTREEVISLIAERFAHEIRNSLVPLSTHAQLLDRKISDPKFQASLKSALLGETKRIKRFSEQMLYIAQESAKGEGQCELGAVLNSAFDQAKHYLHLEHSHFELQKEVEDAFIKGSVEALNYAFLELFLNALQANMETPNISAIIQSAADGNLCICIRDNGPGFEPPVIDQATEPFFTTRNTGVGLGLSVAKKIIQENGGRLELFKRQAQDDWDLKITFPSLIATPT